MPPVECDPTELFIRNIKCTGDVPPALIGSTLTYLGGTAYVFGGRDIHTGKLTNEVYACNLRNFVWRRIPASENTSPPHNGAVAGFQTPSSPTQRPMSRQGSFQTAPSPPPSPRFFHSATAFRNYIIIFGGMGLETATATENTHPEKVDVEDDRQRQEHHTQEKDQDQQPQQQQQQQKKTIKVLLGDVSVFDTKLEQWSFFRVLDAPSNSIPPTTPTSADPMQSQLRPSPRYAHLAALLGSRLLIVGGQDLDEQYIEELNIFDLRSGQWVLRAPFPCAVGLYRSFISSIPDNGRTLIYSNYSFSAVRRALYSLSAPPDCTLREVSDAISGEPPGLRFPRGFLIDSHTLIMTGTLMSSEGHSELSLWTLDTNELRWTAVNCGARFRSGSWNQSVVDPRTNCLIVFGDSRRDLAYDYQRRRLNYNEVRSIDMRALGFIGVSARAGIAPTLSTPGTTPNGPGLRRASVTAHAAATAVTSTAAAAGKTALGNSSASNVSGLAEYMNNLSSTSASVKNLSEGKFELGAQLLLFSQFGDSEIISADGAHVAFVNSGILHTRWPQQAHKWLVNTAATAETGPIDDARNMSTPPPESHGPLRPDGHSNESDKYSRRTQYRIDSSREAINMLVFYLYTGKIDSAARFGPPAAIVSETPLPDNEGGIRALGDLFILSRKYDLNPLSLLVLNILREAVTPTTSPLIYEAALNANHRGLQARCVVVLRDCTSGLVSDNMPSLYTMTEAARSSLLKYFPRDSTNDNTQGSDSVDPVSPAHPRTGRQDNLQNDPSQNTARYRSHSDSSFSADPNTPLRPAPHSSPRGPPSRSPSQQAGLSEPRRPWEATTMNSPVINSPQSGRFSSYSPDYRNAESPRDGKRLSNMSPLAYQVLPEDSAVSYAAPPLSRPSTNNTFSSEHTVPANPTNGSPQNSGGTHPQHAIQQSQASAYGGSHHQPSSANAGTIATARTGDQAPSSFADEESRNKTTGDAHDPQEPSSRNSIFRPWSKMKRIASSSSSNSSSTVGSSVHHGGSNGSGAPRTGASALPISAPSSHGSKYG